ncbi:MAG: N-acetylneuraminate synthase [Elusimicrobia bacterium RIFOXYA12_FULL_51_18]|nr:MAG: N-acetylneuraminate synthase [Elusimicrobia bacterium RIFOXYA12_FULL_51_18]OGS32867.1 MAG: N-acetylneuraminate synthase [Elusimicrobia bacterium RIFOXYA2_FULL_53_38]
MKKRVFIVAEAGVNHNGSLAVAKKLAAAAKMAGADAVKFQTFKASSLVTPFAPKAAYQIKTTGLSDSQFQMLKKLELSGPAHRILSAYCRKLGIRFLSSPFDPESVDFLLKLGLSIIKVPSGEITNLPYLRKVGAARRKVILSTGMATLKEIGAALKVLTTAGTTRRNIVLLHCSTEYPAPMKDVNLSAMLTIAKKFKVRVGYSDHTEGIEVSLAAAALGAKVIEKHLTLDRKMKGPDHKASLEPREFRDMVKAVRNIEAVLGTGIKKPSLCELRNAKVVRKSLTAIKTINKGEAFSAENIAPMRPAGGMSPMLWDKVIGRPAPRCFKPGEKVKL